MPSASRPYDAMPIDLGRSRDGRIAYSLVSFPAERAEEFGEAFAAIDPWASYPYTASALSFYFSHSEPGAPRYALLAGDEIAGVVGLRLNWLRGPYLQFLGLLPGHQGKGAGGLVLAWMERAARSVEDRNLWVCASDFNRDGMKFYKSHGFARIGEIHGLVHDGKTEVLFRKRLR